MVSSVDGILMARNINPAPVDVHEKVRLTSNAKSALNDEMSSV